MRNLNSKFLYWNFAKLPVSSWLCCRRALVVFYKDSCRRADQMLSLCHRVMLPVHQLEPSVATEQQPTGGDILFLASVSISLCFAPVISILSLLVETCCCCDPLCSLYVSVVSNVHSLFSLDRNSGQDSLSVFTWIVSWIWIGNELYKFLQQLLYMDLCFHLFALSWTCVWNEAKKRTVNEIGGIFVNFMDIVGIMECASLA